MITLVKNLPPISAPASIKSGILGFAAAICPQTKAFSVHVWEKVEFEPVAANTQLKAAPCWVWVRRVGNSFTNFMSPDGTTWTQVGTSRSITMGSNVSMGLCVSPHLKAELNTSIFKNASVTP